MYSTGIDWDSGSMTCSAVAAAFCDALAKLCRREPVGHYSREFPCGARLDGDTVATSVAAITCESCRRAIRADKCAPRNWDPWGKDANDAGMATAKELSDELKGLLAMGEAMLAPCPPSGHSWSIDDICERCRMRRSEQLACLKEPAKGFANLTERDHEFVAAMLAESAARGNGYWGPSIASQIGIDAPLPSPLALEMMEKQRETGFLTRESYTFANRESIVPLPNWDHGRGDILGDIKAAMAELRKNDANTPEPEFMYRVQPRFQMYAHPKFPAAVYDPEPQPAPTPAELYTRFRETVERVVREEAHGARVVTDVTPAILRERPAQFLVDFEWGQYRRQWSHNFDAPVTQFESSIRQHCECALREAGARAMGRK